MQFSKYKGKSKRLLNVNDEVSLIDLSLEQLIESDFHLGSKLSKFQKLNYSFVFSRRFNVLILNLTYSLYNLRLSLYFITAVVSRRGKVLFFDSHESTRIFVHYIGSTSRQFYINRKWIAGLLTNFKNFYPAVFTGISRHFRFSEHKYAGMRYIHRPPNVSCLLNLERGSSAFLENFRLGISTVALVSSNNDISGVTFPIFSNNNSIYTFYSFFGILRSAVLNGYKDEIYKFYRRSLKKILKTRFQKISQNSYNANFFSHFFRHYLIKISLSYNSLFYNFFSFILNYAFNETNTWVSKVFFSFVNHLLYFNERYLINSNSYSIFDTNFADNCTITSLDKNFLDNFLRYLTEIFFSEDFFKFFTNFSSLIHPFFLIFFNLFVSKNLITNFEKFRSFFRDFMFGLFLLKKWEKSRLIQFKFFDPKRHFSHEIFPFFQFRRIISGSAYVHSQELSSFYIYHRILDFNAKNSGFFFDTLSIFKLSSVSSLFRNFKRLGSFKAFYFSKKIKRSLRISSKRLKFFLFLWRALYPKKKHKRNTNFSNFSSLKQKKILKLSKTFNTTIKSAHKRKQLRNTYNLTMLNYFDEDYEDKKFPFNNEFFFLHVAYGSIFLAREQARNRVIASQRDFSVVLNKRKKSFSRVKSNSRLLRLFVYFPILKLHILKVKGSACHSQHTDFLAS